MVSTGGAPTEVRIYWGKADAGRDSAAWTNVQCTDCGLLLPDDPRPSPLVPPFEHVDGVDRVVCGG